MGRLILIRHCETRSNVEGTVQGRRNLALSDRGEKQAVLVGEYVRGNFSIDRVISSNRKRCIQTAAEIDQNVEINPLLREIHWGDWEGKKWADVKREYPDDVEALLTADPTFTTPNGDSLMSFIQRIDQAISDLDLVNLNGDIAIVSHEGTVRTMITRLLGWPSANMANLTAFPGSVSVISASYASAKLETLNYYDHLAPTYEGQR
ncbi:histidine phosphatase family protein [Candidatus Lucifugimonas marina]|uniref:histidine phosphatase family protein n=1 Tax=Candidatus Lucifugimonas marina TaxID=3038979 RepID=UPI00319EAEB5